MPTNANVFNTRVTSEALEAKFRNVFPSQGGAELVQDLYASGVIQPVVDFSTIAEGSVLAANLQTAWDFSTGNLQITSAAYNNVITTPGFWQIDLTHTGFEERAAISTAAVAIYDGATRKPVWARSSMATGSSDIATTIENSFVVFLRAGDRVQAKCQLNNSDVLDLWYRQVGTVTGELVNPLGFVFQ